MKSMTGFGRGTAPLGTNEVAVQVSSVNRKHLEIGVSLPEAWNALEAAVTEKVKAVAQRGTIKVRIETGGSEAAAGWNEAVVAQALEQLAGFAQKHGLAFAPTSELLWQIGSNQRASGGLPPVEAAREAVLAALVQALKEFSTMRAREGAVLQADLTERTGLLAGCVATLAAQAPKVPAAYRELLFQRLRQAGLELDLNDERVLKEIALFADRSDVSEELTRLRSHLDQFGELLKSEGEIGRKAEFILQEIGREIHTTGSKANDLIIAKAVIEFKNELERIREQLANVE
jgi:uncharacterized protein (TIGR00255 family)